MGSRRQVRVALGLIGLLSMVVPAAAATAADQASERAGKLVAQMTPAEKIAQLQSAAPAIPRLGIPAYEWWSEGLHGFARSGEATVFPQAIGLAASWDPALLHAVGGVVAAQARDKFMATGLHQDHPRYNGLTIWSPNINIFRDPRWGRGQETYGEDPRLTAALAVAFIEGLQGSDPSHPTVIATPKHFAVHSGPEPGRHGFDVDVSPHDLEDTYLPAFRAAIVEAQAGSVMCAYNAIRGVPACALPWLLGERLRHDWSFKGYVVTDCDAVDDMTKFHYYRKDNAGSAASALRAGTDLNCGVAYDGLRAALAHGDISEHDLDTAATRLFAARYRLGMFDAQATRPRIDAAADRALALRAAGESIVLLKNRDSTLPLKPGVRLAVVGPNADALSVLEANYHGTARHPVTPLEGLRQQLGSQRVGYAQGAALAEGVPVPVPVTALRVGDGSDTPGLKGEYFRSTDLSGSPVATRIDSKIDMDTDHAPPVHALGAGGYSVRWTGQLLPPGPGNYTLVVRQDRCFDCKGHDPVRLYVDGRLLITSTGDNEASAANIAIADARPRDIRVEWQHSGEDQGIHLQWIAPADAQLAEARRVADQADVVVAFVGLSPDVEGEELKVDVPGFLGGDRTDIGLPATQRRLLESVAASGKPLVVVLMSGSAVALNWANEHADAILAAWYPGEQGGVAIAQTLAGVLNPSGRLPVTFYRDARDLPPFIDYGMKGRTYRYFRGEPLYAFGDGLSYTRFAYGAPSVSSAQLKAGDPLDATVSVRNSGARAGDEVVQVYLAYPDAANAPQRALVGFQRVSLAPGEQRDVTFRLDARALSLVDADGVRAVREGRYQLFAGGHQPSPGQVPATFTISGHADVAR
ncbi:glycoside hydrolase family 3 C-terminal domain-containing protein [Dyella telluris]|uniref:Glycoside hydrolase family 3 C-terminal domain-containing protein n=2 Tax=Dyella telluris TaxID=2763498 RepID=A0A7G8Q395_9GAMM|nr:glycoside hydrolase family 3 C-terminal domain-containing protein [Dyella telluris]